MGTQRAFAPGIPYSIGTFHRQGQRQWHPFVGTILAIPDATGPVVTLVSPSEGSIAATDNVHVTVTDNYGLVRCILGVRLSIGTTDEKFEFIHDGDGFAVGYTFTPNARTVITDGFDFVLKRLGGWPGGAMKFMVYSFDTDGNED